MNSKLFPLLFIAFISLDTCCTVQILRIFNYNDCEGKDASNYTIISAHLDSNACDPNDDDSGDDSSGTQLRQTQAHGVLAVNSLVKLASSVYPAGAYKQTDKLWLVAGGPLAGKYVYEKKVYLQRVYLKKCSSVLGYSYVMSKSAVLLISDRLDMNVLISPTGGYEVFKKGCTTVCNGVGYYF